MVSKGGKPQISAIVCTYSNASLLRRTLDSLIKQTLPPQEYEIIVVDNNSTDNTRDVVRDFQERCSHQIHYVLETTQGLSAARNTGIQHSSGPIISFIDDDAEATPDWLAAVVEAFRQNPDAWGVGGNIFAIWDAKRPAWLKDDFLSDLSILDRGPDKLKLTPMQIVVGTNCSFRREVFAEIGYFTPELGRVGKSLLAGEEAELCLRIHLQGKSMYHIPDVVVFHHVTPERMTRSYFNRRLYFSGLSRAFYVSRTYGLTFASHELREWWQRFALRILSDGKRCLTLKRPNHTLFRHWTWFRLCVGYTRGLRQIRRTFFSREGGIMFRGGKTDDTKTSTSKLEPIYVSDNIVGPFKRNAHAHIGENALIAALLVGQTKTGVMIDVGAMCGSTLSQFYHAGWRVFAFEPDPTNQKELEIRFGHNPNLTIDGRAVADRIAENMPFYSSTESPGISSLHPFHKSHKETCTVSTTTIADFVREKDLHHIDYLKIDAESYDLLILKGVPWDSIKPNVIMCEFEDNKTRSLGYTMHDMARYLIERGYKVLVSEWHPIIRYGIKHDWHRLVPYPCELSDPNAWGNLIAFRDQPDLQEIATIARRIVKIDTERTGLRDKGLYQRLVDYLKTHYPMIITLGRLGKCSLTTLKNTFFGIGGIFLLVITGLYVAGALIEPLRWYLVGTASALLLLFGGLLALSYARLWLNRFTSDQRTQVWDIRSDVKKEVSDVKKEVSDIKKALRESETELKKEISNSKNTLAKMNVGNFPLFQPFNRRLTNEDLKRFAGEWAPKLGLDLDARALAYIAHRICLAEDTCVGRLAGNIETMLLRVLVARSVMEPKLEVLEIGTMFGVGVAMIHENCRGFFNDVHVTVIDPLSGYYGGDNLDTMTKIPVTRDIFVHNMQRMNIPKADYTIIEKLSTEDEAIEQASKKRYNLLIIDGDHSYSGVKHDFYNYRHLVKRGGYIVFDDYGNPNWSEIKDFVDKEVVGMPELEFVGTDVYSAVFRVIAPQELTKRGRKQHK